MWAGCGLRVENAAKWWLLSSRALRGRSFRSRNYTGAGRVKLLRTLCFGKKCLWSLLPGAKPVSAPPFWLLSIMDRTTNDERRRKTLPSSTEHTLVWRWTGGVGRGGRSVPARETGRCCANPLSGTEYTTVQRVVCVETRQNPKCQH